MQGSHAAHDRVLVVDDEEVTRYLIRQLLPRGVYDVQEATTGTEGLARLFNKPPDVLLLDLKMPFKNGFEVLSWIRKQPALAHLRVFVLSGSVEPHDMRAAYELGATFYLVKPLILDRLVQACGTVQDRWLCIGKPSAGPASHHN